MASEERARDPDVELMLRTRDGDLRCFEQLFQKYSKSLLNFVMRFVRSQAQAEELAQEIFLKIYRARERYEPRSRFKTYLFRVATNHCLNELRRGEHRERFESLDTAPSEDDGRPLELADESPTSEEVLAAQRLANVVETALATLPESQRAALMLLRFEGFSYDEIADALDTSVPAVKSLLNRAKVALKGRLASYLEANDELHPIPR